LYDDKAGLTGPNYYVGYYESMAPVASMRKLCVLPNALSLGSTANCTDFYWAFFCLPRWPVPYKNG